MNYNIISLTTMNPDGSLTRFENGAAGKLLVGVSDSQLPAWKTLAEAHVASDTHNHSAGSHNSSRGHKDKGCKKERHRPE